MPSITGFVYYIYIISYNNIRNKKKLKHLICRHYIIEFGEEQQRKFNLRCE